MSEIQKFIFSNLPVRGAIVRIDQPWQEILKLRSTNSKDGAYPASLTQLLGQMTAASILLKSSITFDGSLILQIQGGGPIRLAVVEVQPNLQFRSTAQLAHAYDKPLPTECDLEQLLNQNKLGRCAITLDSEVKRPGYQPYQGIVSLCDAHGQTLPNIAQVLAQYMRQSEQLDTVFILAANDHVTAGLMVQRMPIKGQGNLAGQNHIEDETQVAQDFQRISVLAQSLTNKELLELAPSNILHRLFWQENIKTLDSQVNAPTFACRCSLERVTNMLRGLGQKEVECIIAEQGQVEIACDFCAQEYRFDSIDATALFLSGTAPEKGCLQ